MDRIKALRISILVVDGRFDLYNEATPTSLPLFDKLVARGYGAPGSALWNPMAALFGALPTITQRLKDLQARRDEAQGSLEAVLRERPTTTATG